MIFALALPVVVLAILGGVFGNEAEADVFRGVGAMSYYVPAYLALVAASVAIVNVPTHLAGSRERGVLRRLHASGVAAWSLVAAEMTVAVAIATVSALVLLATAALALDDFSAPVSPALVIAAFALGAIAFAAVGVLIGAVLSTARAAQGLGIMVWFVMLFLGGAGPPPEVLSTAMQGVGEATPLPYARPRDSRTGGSVSMPEWHGSFSPSSPPAPWRGRSSSSGGNDRSVCRAGAGKLAS